MNAQKLNHEYDVTFYIDNKKVDLIHFIVFPNKVYKNFSVAEVMKLKKRNGYSKSDYWAYLKNWLNIERDRGNTTARFEIVEKVHYKPLTSLFLDKETRDSLGQIMKKFKELYASYAEDEFKKARLKKLAVNMWNSIQNEFFHSAKICPNTIWSWQDRIAEFDEFGYLQEEPESVELSDWAVHLKGWYRRDWSIEVLKLITDFNLDNQNPDYSTAFKNDFKRVRNEQEFCSALMKWSDLIYWSPWKLSLLDNTFQQPLNVHYEDDFNPECDEDILD